MFCGILVTLREVGEITFDFHEEESSRELFQDTNLFWSGKSTVGCLADNSHWNATDDSEESFPLGI